MLIVVLLVDFVKVTTWALLGHILLQSHFLLTVHQKVLNLLLVQLFLNLLFLLSWFGFLFLTAIIFLVFRHIVFLVSTDASSLCQFFILHLFCLVIHRRCYNIKCLALRFLDLKYKIISFTRNLSISKLFLMRLVLHSFWLWVATSLLGLALFAWCMMRWSTMDLYWCGYVIFFAIIEILLVILLNLIQSFSWVHSILVCHSLWWRIYSDGWVGILTVSWRTFLILMLWKLHLNLTILPWLILLLFLIWVVIHFSHSMTFALEIE